MHKARNLNMHGVPKFLIDRSMIKNYMNLTIIWEHPVIKNKIFGNNNYPRRRLLHRLPAPGPHPRDDCRKYDGCLWCQVRQ